MAYTVPVLDCYAGKVACYLVDPAATADDAPLLNPLTAANLPRVLWHSDLDYLEVVQDQTVVLTCPTRLFADHGAGADGDWYWYDHQPFAAFTAAGAPYGAVQINGALSIGWDVMTTPRVGDNNGGGERVLAPRIEANMVVVRERWRNELSYVQPYWKSSAPAQTFTIRSIVWGARTKSPSLGLIDMDGSTGRLALGSGLIDTANTRGFMRESATPTGIAFTVDRTVDSVPGAMRRWNLDGTFSDLQGSYPSGMYAGPRIRHVTV